MIGQPGEGGAGGGLYRSAHATPDDDQRHPEDGVTLISVDDQDQGLPAEELPGPPADRTASNSMVMAIGSVVSRVIGFVRNALIGMTLGGGIGDAYATAYFLPSQIYEMLLGGILSSVLIPLLVRRRKADPDEGLEFTRRLLTFAMVSLGIATLIVMLAAPLITAVQVSDRKPAAYHDLVTHFSWVLLPIIFFTGLSGLISAVLNVRGHFAAPMWAPILNNIVVIAACGAFILFFGTAGGLAPQDMTPARVAVIGGGTMLGMVVQALGLLPALRKVGFSWRWRWAPKSLGLREIGGLAGWMLLYTAANQVAIFVAVRLLNRVNGAEDASVLAFNNVFLLTMMAHGIIGVSVMTALLPKMSAAAADGRFHEVSADLTRGIRLVTTALAPIAIVYGVLGTPISVVLFQGGAYSNQVSIATGTVLVVGAFALLPLSLQYLCNYAFYSLQGNRTVALINLPVVAVRIGGYVLLTAVLDVSLSAAGMTAANAISYLLSALISLAVLRRRIGRLNLASMVAGLAKVAVAAAVAGVLGWLAVRVLPSAGVPDGRLEALPQLLVGGLVILVAYVGMGFVLRIPEISQVTGMIRRRIGR